MSAFTFWEILPRCVSPARRAMLLAVCLGFATPSAGQTAKNPAPSPVVQDTSIQPGFLDFSGYKSPGACTEAVWSIMNAHRRTWLDTTTYGPERDTMPSIGAKVASACRKPWAAELPSNEWFDRFQLSLVMDDDARVSEYAERWLSLFADKPVVERAWVLSDLFSKYMAVRPMRRKLAEQTLLRLDSLGNEAFIPRLVAHTGMFVHGETAFDIDVIEREGRILAPLYKRLSPDEARKAGRAFNVSSLHPQFTMLIADTYRTRKTGKPASTSLWEGETGSPLGHEAIFRQLFPFMFQPAALPSLPATFWYNSKKSVWPVEGKVSLLFNMGQMRAVGPFRYALFATIRRLREKYGNALDIVILVRTQGFIHDSAPLTPAQEAEEIRKYFLEFLKLPVTVAVAETEFQRKPDGRRVDGKAAFERLEAYIVPGFGMPVEFVIADQAGKSVLRSMGTIYEATLDAYVAMLLAEGSGSSSARSAP